jgi:hypothetical protein
MAGRNMPILDVKSNVKTMVYDSVSRLVSIFIAWLRNCISRF